MPCRGGRSGSACRSSDPGCCARSPTRAGRPGAATARAPSPRPAAGCASSARSATGGATLRTAPGRSCGPCSPTAHRAVCGLTRDELAHDSAMLSTARTGCHVRTGSTPGPPNTPSPVRPAPAVSLAWPLIWTEARPGTLQGRQEKRPARRGDALLAGWPVPLAGSRYSTRRQLGAGNMTNHTVTRLSPPGRARRPLGQPVPAGHEHRAGRKPPSLRCRRRDRDNTGADAGLSPSTGHVWITI